MPIYSNFLFYLKHDLFLYEGQLKLEIKSHLIRDTLHMLLEDARVGLRCRPLNTLKFPAGLLQGLRLLELLGLLAELLEAFLHLRVLRVLLLEVAQNVAKEGRPLIGRVVSNLRVKFVW